MAKGGLGERQPRRLASPETGTLPWLVRKPGPHEARISARRQAPATGVFPMKQAAVRSRSSAVAFPGAIEPCGDVLSGALMNAGRIHPPLIIMNAAARALESWAIHNEGTHASIRRVTDALDRVRVRISRGARISGAALPARRSHAATGGNAMYGRGSPRS